MTSLIASHPKTQRLERLTALVNDALERTLPKAALPPQVVHEAMRYCVFPGGKRFRPLLCLGACEAVGAPARQALSAACAVELIHTYSLVHDDLPAMDNADERRGQPACHRKFGEGNAILVGDALLTLAFELLSRNGAPNSLAIIRRFGHACGTVGLIGGQVLDLQVISQPRTSTERTLRDIAQRKTAALISASVAAGALAGGAASGPPLKRLERYGQEIGLAFQLVDDVHDVEGLARVMGADQARSEAKRLITRAVRALEPFGKRAGILRQLADWLVAISAR
ncbi:MAG: polyprenyl synthetase family protein [Candidatus Omnitrophica bacterium]|nr:polyprenyl synthetase family protein [Candidatus Omnitrophota bacterium]